jgi:hypothetical protein
MGFVIQLLRRFPDDLIPIAERVKVIPYDSSDDARE